MIPGSSAGFSSLAEASPSASDLSSESLDSAFQFQAWHTSGLEESPQSFQANDVWRRYTAWVVDPVISIPAGENIAPTQLQWRFASEQLVNMLAVSPVEMVAYPHSSDGTSFAGVTMGVALPIMPEAESRVDSSTGSVSFSYAGLEELRRQLGKISTTLNAVMVSNAEGTITEEDSQAEVFGDSHRFRDTRLENILHQYREFSAIVEQELRLRMAQMQRPLRSASGESPADRPGTNLSSGNEADGEVANSSARAGQLSREQPEQPSDQQKEAETPATDTDGAAKPLCEHYVRRCYVRFPCCNDYYACHQCHNGADKCDKTGLNARNATHLKCAECLVEQEINEDSQHCSACSAKLADYFCSKCKHFAQQEIKPYHCDKCGICRTRKDKAFHCDVCNICLDKRLQGIHNCQANSGHNECGICLESVFSGCEVLPCSHKLHNQCLISMIQKKHTTCPICRHSIYAPHKQG